MRTKQTHIVVIDEADSDAVVSRHTGVNTGPCQAMRG